MKRILKKAFRIFKRLLGVNPIDQKDDERQWRTISYAQEGEDMILSRFLSDKNVGYYVDIGAHHPYRFSNTYFFYKSGWRGINVDALPGTKVLFDKERPRDVTIEMGISSTEGALQYYMFNEPALNTFSEEEAIKKDALEHYYIQKKVEIQTVPLKILLDNYLPENQHIDFMTIDVEGLDLIVLKSNDWELYRPKFLLIENLVRQPIQELVETSELYSYLTSKDYELISKSMNTLFFKDKRD